MWPFTTHLQEETAKSELREWRDKWPPGKQFEYLGVKLIVANNVELYPSIGFVQIITANYLDNGGVIQVKQFFKAEMDGINNDKFEEYKLYSTTKG